MKWISLDRDLLENETRLIISDKTLKILRLSLFDSFLFNSLYLF
jgi:hypothetical protein